MSPMVVVITLAGLAFLGAAVLVAFAVRAFCVLMERPK